MKKRIHIFVLAIILIISLLSACTIKGQDINNYIESSIENTLQEEAYYAKFELSIDTLVSDVSGIIIGAEYENKKVSYEVIYNNGEHYCKIINGDIITEIWLGYEGDNRIIFQREKAGSDDAVELIKDYVEGDSINILADLLIKYSSLSEQDVLLRDGIKRIGYDMIKVKTEEIFLINEDLPYRERIGKDNPEAPEYKYFWNNIIESHKETINLTVKDDKVVKFEIIREIVEGREKSGQIAIGESHIGVVIEIQEINIEIVYIKKSIPAK